MLMCMYVCSTTSCCELQYHDMSLGIHHVHNHTYLPVLCGKNNISHENDYAHSWIDMNSFPRNWSRATCTAILLTQQFMQAGDVSSLHTIR